MTTPTTLSWKTKKFSKNGRGWILTRDGKRLGTVAQYPFYDEYGKNQNYSDYIYWYRAYLGGRSLGFYPKLVDAKIAVETTAGVNCQHSSKRIKRF